MINLGDWQQTFNDEDQLKRFNSSKKFECTPIMFNREDATATFQGKSHRYQTSLNNCECVDFIRNQKACKHMYRLALEMGLLEGTFESNVLKISNQLSTEHALTFIDILSDEAQKIVQDFLYYHLYKKRENYGYIKSTILNELLNNEVFIVCDDAPALFDPFGRNELNEKIAPYSIPGFKKNLKKEKLIDWVIATAPHIITELTSDAVAVTLHPKFTKTKRKVYSHLKQKFPGDEIWI